MICDFCSKDKQYYAYPGLCQHRYCMRCLLNEVFKELKCVICNQHQQSIVHNLTSDGNTSVLPFKDSKMIRKFIANMFLILGIEDEETDRNLLESDMNKKLYLEEIENHDETGELSDLNIDE